MESREVRLKLACKWPKWRELGLITACYAIILLPPFFAELWKGYSGVYYLYDSRNQYIANTVFIIALISIGLACLTQYTGRLQRVVFVVFMLILSFLGTMALIHVAVYDAPISVGAVDAVLGTDLHEALEYLTFHWSTPLTISSGIFVVLFLLALALVWRRLSPGMPCAKSHALAWTAIVVLILVAYQFPAVAAYNHDQFSKRPIWSRASELNRQIPSVRILQDVENWMEYRQWLEETQQIRAVHDYGAILGNAALPRTIVLVLGESLRRDRMSLYGYARATTPRLAARRKQIMLFEGAISPSNQTVPSLTKMLTPATVREPDRFLTEPSILAAANKAGYRTFWLSNQGRVGHFDTPISLMAHDADTTIFTNTEFYGSVYDEALLHPLKVVLAKPDPHKFIILHTLGSHQSYRNRYPAEKAYFRAEHYAADLIPEEQATIQAEYDNTVRYTDEVLDQVLAELEKYPNSALLYVSDHGERLFDQGVGSCGHGFPEPTRSEFDVPYFVWCNGKCPRNWQRGHARNRVTAFNTENLFHTIANLLGLNMKEYRAQDDILSPKYQPEAKPEIIDVNRGVHTYVSLPTSRI